MEYFLLFGLEAIVVFLGLMGKRSFKIANTATTSYCILCKTSQYKYVMGVRSTKCAKLDVGVLPGK